MELDKRDGVFGPMSAPLPQQMSRLDQPVPPGVGYPPGGPVFDQPYAPPPPPYGGPVYNQPPPAYGAPVYNQPPPYGYPPHGQF